MSELQDTLRQIMSNPEAMRQVQSLGEQLGLNTASSAFSAPSASAPPAPVPAPPDTTGSDMLSAFSKLAPLMRAPQNDETAALLNALRPFLSEEKQERLRHAQRLIGLMRVIPLLKDSGLFL